jgi:hypothetical protein
VPRPENFAETSELVQAAVMYSLQASHLRTIVISGGDDVIQGYLDVIIFNTTASTILKCLRFKFQIFSFAQQWFGTEIEAYILPKAVKLY